MLAPKNPVRPTDPANQEKGLRWQIHLAGLLLVFGVAIAYAGTVNAPFIFDDEAGIISNQSIRHLWPLSDVLWGPGSTGAGGRPIVNLSLALNYAVGGLDVRGYHLFNGFVHAAVTLLLFGLLRRTLLGPVLGERFKRRALSLSFVLTALWSLHPLLTESVTCVIQRTESLGAFFYLLTLYAFVRSVEGETRYWQVISVGACLVGMATKETLATAPVIVLLFDRAFTAGSFKAAWSVRRRYYWALAATWVLLAVLVAANDDRGDTVGYGLGMSAWSYALTQCRAIILYLKLAFWPHPLVVDYGDSLVQGVGAVWMQGVLLLALVAGTLVALVRKPVVGFLAFAFFAILAPSSSFIPLTTQTMAEHRMYLPLVAVVILVMAGFDQRWPKWTVPVAAVLSLLGLMGTLRRNQDYRTEFGLWAETVKQSPTSARARLQLGNWYLQAGRYHEAIKAYQAAMKCKPRYMEAEFNLGNAYDEMQQYRQAAVHYQRAVEFQPQYTPAHYALANVLVRLGRVNEALPYFASANRLKPREPRILRGYARALICVGRHDEALARYHEAMQLSPDDPILQAEAGQLLIQMHRPKEALSHFEKAVQLDPRQTRARYAMAMLLSSLGRYAEAEVQFTAVVKTAPCFAEARNGFGMVLLDQGRWNEAVSQLQMALQLKPDFAEAQINLDRATLMRDLRGSGQRCR